MYLSQAFSAKNKWVYSLVCILVILTLSPNPFSPSNNDDDLKKMIADMGELPSYALLLFTFAILLFPLFFIVNIIHHQSLTQFTTSRKKIDWNRVLFSIGIFGGLQTLYFFISFLSSPEDFVWNFQPIPFFFLLLISLLFLPIQIGFEEYFFRGYFMQWLGLLFKNKWIPLFASSIFFGFVHFGNPEVQKLGFGIMFFYISSGFLLGISALMDEGLELPLGIHFANNFTIALLSTSDWTVFQTPSLFKDISTPEITFSMIIMEILINLLTLYIFSKKYKWKNWKEKLFGKLPIPNNN